MHDLTFMILTGGKSSRFGSNKSEINFAGTTLLNRLLENLPPAEVIIVGPEVATSLQEITFVREEPIGGGPVAAIAAGVEKATSEWVVVLATDLPFASEIVPLLVNAMNHKIDGVIPIDQGGQRQILCALYTKSALKRALVAIGNPEGKSMRSLISQLNLRELLIPSNTIGKLIDIDTPEDLAKALEIQRQEESKK